MNEQRGVRVPELWEIDDQVNVVGHSIHSTDENDPIKETGWFRTFADLADAAEIWFLNVRNKVAGLHNNTQDVRDSMPWGYRALEISLDWWISSTVQHIPRNDPPAPGFNDNRKLDAATAHLWRVVIPRETSFEFFVSNDSKLELNCGMIPGGCGFTGGGFASGYDFFPGTPPNGHTEPNYFPAATAYAQVCNGVPTRRLEQVGTEENGAPIFAGGAGGWPQAFAIDLPKGVNISARLMFSPYAKSLLRAMNTGYVLASHGSDYSGEGPASQVWNPVKAGIHLRIHGTSYKQQRGSLER